jgi:two-component system LytT family response regulator
MKIIIIDDEPHCRNVIERVLETHCPEVQVVATCADGIEGLKAIVKHQPDVVFLDIEMPRLNGFQMLESLGEEDLNFALIFTTAYDKFAVKAFQFSAFNYLLKPIDDSELVATVQKLERKIMTPSAQMQALRSHLQHQTPFNKLTIATTRGITFIELADIIAFEADGNYSKIYQTNGDAILASKTLGHFDNLLSEHTEFFRTHKQFIINLHSIKEYIAGDQNTIVMRNGLQARLARTRREAFLALFKF